MTARRTLLESGVTVVSEAMPVRGVAFGMYFPTGSRNETRDNNGISHFIEHLVFKGTERRSADEINREIDLLGGASNAYTSKEVICFHARVLGEHLPRIVEFFADMASGALPEGVDPEVERERDVILSEISAVEDAPEDLVGDLCDEAFFGPHPLALPVVGTADAVERIKLDEIRRHFRNHLVAPGLVVAAAGAVEHEPLVALVREHLAGLPRVRGLDALDAPTPRPATRLLERDTEQVQVCLSAGGVSRGDPRRTALDLLSLAVGDGFSSRLFREVRDRRGLAYSIYSSPSAYIDCGSFNIYFGVAPERVREALDVVGKVLAEIRAGGLREDELEAARLHLRGSTLLAQESSSARMGYLAEQALLGSDQLDYHHDIEIANATTLGDLRELAAELLAQPLAAAVVGPAHDGSLPEGGFEIGA